MTVVQTVILGKGGVTFNFSSTFLLFSGISKMFYTRRSMYYIDT